MKRRCEIRLSRPTDFEAVLPLLRQLWPDENLDSSALQKVFDHALQADGQVYLCATIGDNVVGFISLTLKNTLWKAGYIGHIDELIVDTKYRRRGIGTKLLQSIIVRAKECGCRRVELDSAFHREEAHRFYEQHGFENRAYLFSKVLS